MEPFNIRIMCGSEEVTLTILPSDNGDFKIIYYGGILGGVKKNGNNWDLLSPDQVAGEDLPLYEPRHGEDRIEIVLTDLIADRIGDEIDLHFQD